VLNKSFKLKKHRRMDREIKIKKACFKTPSQETSVRMRLIKSSGTKLEWKMEEIFEKIALSYVRQPRLLGRPDFRIKGTNVVVFCDSSFWHGRKERERNGLSFKKNRKFWAAKLTYNRKRDLKTNRALKREGWRVLRFWDTDIFKFPEKVSSKLLIGTMKNG